MAGLWEQDAGEKRRWAQTIEHLFVSQDSSFLMPTWHWQPGFTRLRLLSLTATDIARREGMHERELLVPFHKEEHRGSTEPRRFYERTLEND